MKRIALFFILVLSAVSCEKPVATPAPQHIDGSINFTFKEDSGVLSSDGRSVSTFEYDEIPWLHIGKNVMGNLIVSVEENKETTFRSSELDVIFDDGVTATVSIRQNAKPSLSKFDINSIRDQLSERDLTTIDLELGEDTYDIRLWMVPKELAPDVMDLYINGGAPFIDYMLNSDREDIYDYQEYCDIVNQYGEFVLEGVPFIASGYRCLYVFALDMHDNVGKIYDYSMDG